MLPANQAIVTLRGDLGKIQPIKNPNLLIHIVLSNLKSEHPHFKIVTLKYYSNANAMEILKSESNDSEDCKYFC